MIIKKNYSYYYLILNGFFNYVYSYSFSIDDKTTCWYIKKGIMCILKIMFKYLIKKIKLNHSVTKN